MGRIARWVPVFCVCLYLSTSVSFQVIFLNLTNAVHPFTNSLTHTLPPSITSFPSFSLSGFPSLSVEDQLDDFEEWDWWTYGSRRPGPLQVHLQSAHWHLPAKWVVSHKLSKQYALSQMDPEQSKKRYVLSLQISPTISLHLYPDMEGTASTRWAEKLVWMQHSTPQWGLAVSQ